MKLSLLASAIFLSACASCAGTQHPGRSPKTMHDSTVKITTHCGESSWHGSGVIVSDDMVLTANHVVQCELFPGIPLYVAPDRVTIDPGDGVEREAEIDIALGEGVKDIARLKMKSASLTEFMSPVKMGPVPELGEQVCQSSAVPRWTYRCGTVQPSDGYIRFEGRVEHGNSGSGLYNSRGQLIGIVVQLWLCEANEFCGGRAAPIQNWPWLVP